MAKQSFAGFRKGKKMVLEKGNSGDIFVYTVKVLEPVDEAEPERYLIDWAVISPPSHICGSSMYGVFENKQQAVDDLLSEAKNKGFSKSDCFKERNLMDRIK